MFYVAIFVFNSSLFYFCLETTIYKQLNFQICATACDSFSNVRDLFVCIFYLWAFWNDIYRIVVLFCSKDFPTSLGLAAVTCSRFETTEFLVVVFSVVS